MARKLEGFNDRSMRIVQLSNLAALSTRSTEICTEHLLLGLVRGGTEVVARVLTALGVELTSLKSSVLSALPPARDPAKWRKVPYSSLAERVFDQAREQAASLGKSYVGPAHLLLALLKVEEGTAFTLLAGLGVTYSKARDEVMKPAAHGPSPPARRLTREPSALRPAKQDAERPRADSDLIEKTKRQIRAQVVEIARLARQDIDSLEFYQAFLDRVVSCLAASGGAVWTLSEAGTLELAYEMNFPECLQSGRPKGRPRFFGLISGLLPHLPGGNPQDLKRHAMLLQKTLDGGEGIVIEPRWNAGDGDEACNPTEWLLVLGVLKVNGQPKGLVEIFQRPGAPPTTQRGYLKFVCQMCVLASEYLQSHQ
jgi:hypothetical protein